MSTVINVLPEINKAESPFGKICLQSPALVIYSYIDCLLQISKKLRTAHDAQAPQTAPPQ